MASKTITVPDPTFSRGWPGWNAVDSTLDLPSVLSAIVCDYLTESIHMVFEEEKKHNCYCNKQPAVASYWISPGRRLFFCADHMSISSIQILWTGTLSWPNDPVWKGFNSFPFGTKNLLIPPYYNTNLLLHSKATIGPHIIIQHDQMDGIDAMPVIKVMVSADDDLDPYYVSISNIPLRIRREIHEMVRRRT